MGTFIREKLVDSGGYSCQFLFWSSIACGCTQPLFSNHRFCGPGFCVVLLAIISARNQDKNVA
jgi:hypothetical protein